MKEGAILLGGTPLVSMLSCPDRGHTSSAIVSVVFQLLQQLGQRRDRRLARERATRHPPTPSATTNSQPSGPRSRSNTCWSLASTPSAGATAA
jgi:hypothetical protein